MSVSDSDIMCRFHKQELEKLKQEFELEHWQLSQLEDVSHWPTDYTVTEEIKNRAGTMEELAQFLDKTYA